MPVHIFYALVGDTIRSLLTVSFLLLAMSGWGKILSMFILSHKITPHDNDVSFINTVILGALLTSQVLFYTVYFGWYDYRLVTYYKVIGVLLFLAVYVRRRKLRLKLHCDSKLAICVFVSVVLFFLFLTANNANYFIFGDARQYHLAFPWTMSITGKLFTNDSFTSTGRSLGFDILYMAVNDLARLYTDHHIISEVKTFNFIGEFVFFTSIFTLCRAMGGSAYVSIISALSALSVSSIVLWGALKNDLVVAGVAMQAIALLMTAIRRKCPSYLWLAAMIAAFAITIKMTIVVPVALAFLFVAPNRDFKVKDKMIVLVVGCIVLLPWMMYGLQARGNPFPGMPLPFLVPQSPPAVQAAWAARNANGLTLNPVNFVYYLPQLILDLYHVPANNSLGVVFVAALVYVSYAIVNKFRRKQIALNEIILLSGLLWFWAFSLRQFEGRFLSRYILICPGILFAYTAVQIQSWGSLRENALLKHHTRFILQAMIFIVIIGGVVNSDLTKRHWNALVHLTKIPDATFQNFREREFADMTALYREVEHRRGSHAVAVNDGFLLFLQPPYINLHALHARRLNLYEKDADFIKTLLEQEDVSLILFREGISGYTSALDKYMAQHTRLWKQFGQTVIYDLQRACSDASVQIHDLLDGHTIPFNECSIQKTTGWSREESWGRWTNGEWAAVSFDRYEFPQIDLELQADVCGFTSENHPEQSVDIFANEVYMGTWMFAHGEGVVQRRVVLPAEAIAAQQPLALAFHIKFPVSPVALVDGTVRDPRQLGLGIRSIRFCSAVSIPISTILDKPIAFSEESCLIQRTTGWSYPEPWGTWTDGEWAAVSFDRYEFPQTDLELLVEAQGFTAENHPEQVVEILINNIQVGVWTFTYGASMGQRRVVLPAEVIAAQQPLTLAFHVKSLASPLSLGLSDDSRQLGIGIRNIRFRSAVSVQIRDILDRPIPFNDDSIRKPAGWSVPEPWGSWTDGERAILSFDRYVFPQMALELLADVQGFTTEHHPEQIVDILANGVPVGTWTFAHGEGSVQRRVVLPAEIIAAQQPLTLAFHIKSPASPLSLGLSGDSRQLGIGIRSIRFCGKE